MTSENLVMVDGAATRYLWAGAPGRPTVVFLHDGAWGASADVTWADMIPLAAADYHVIAPDMLGFGGTSKTVSLDTSPFAFRTSHLFRLLEELGIETPVHLVGNSFGGSIALRALTDPTFADRIASVTTINGTGGPWKTEAMAQLGSFDGTADDARRIVGLLCDDFDGFDQQVALRHKWATQPGHYQCMFAPHIPVPEAAQVARPEDPYPSNLTGVTTPILLIEGQHDLLVESGWAGRIAEFVPHATIATMPAKHAPNITHPAQTWQILSGFLAESDISRTVAASASN
ncbi:alpha/beta fold hydrolase [Rhodococcus tukisamuensis]|uniref:Pimeloyl-ACP methyl ester carboxylesterase n=1 Tax=Rhodococcus tukisamuensis TaxID=168276 RepID=A0A1G7ERN0_9NOCA|nr:alpha/beta hydrolase [Rhodococcus tukisamuensis]SDE66289.1 Pimeloyl-ACP methyl ester carboxylesterase [Rhodococcus tukisamuensis]